MTKMYIKEPEFELQIHHWDSFTIDVLKNYSDWKYNSFNGNNNNGNETNDFKNCPVSKKNEEEKNDDLNSKLSSYTTKFSYGEILCKSGENKNSCTIYKPILSFILENIPDMFNREQLGELIFSLYKNNGRIIKTKSAIRYADDYGKYMLDQGLVKQKGSRDLVVIKRTLDDIKEEKKEKKIEVRAPNNTCLFLNWVEKNKILNFSLNDFLNYNACVTKEQAKKILRHQIEIGKLWQMSPSSFKVIK